MRFPHFDFYPGDWSTDAHNRYLSLAEKGAHIELLCLMWNAASEMDFGLVDDDRGISRALGVSVAEWQELRAVLVDGPYAVLVARDGKLVSPRLYEEWQKACAKSEKARESRAQRLPPEPTPDHRTTVPTNVERPLNDRTYERPTSHQSSVTSQENLKREEEDRARETSAPMPADFEQRWMETMGGLIPSEARERLKAYRVPSAHGPPLPWPVISWAMGETSLRAVQGRRWPYLAAILDDLYAHGIDSVTGAQRRAHDKFPKGGHAFGTGPSSRRPLAITAGRHDDDIHSLDELIET